MTAKTLNALTRKELAAMARRKRIGGWHGMRKRELVDALLASGNRDVPGSRRRKKRRSDSASGSRSQIASSRGARNRRLADPDVDDEPRQRDGLEVEVVEDHWVRLQWRISRRIVSRAESALGAEWHRAVPVVRVHDVTRDADGSERSRFVSDVEVDGLSSVCYVPVADMSRTYRFHVGFRAPDSDFFSLVHSRKFSFPRSSGSSRLKHVGEKAPATGNRALARSGSSNGSASKDGRVPFRVDAELLVSGTTHPHAIVTLLGERVELREDGSFSARLSLPDGRQVIPVVSVSPGGAEQRTVVLAIERNTKHLEPESLNEE